MRPHLARTATTTGITGTCTNTPTSVIIDAWGKVGDLEEFRTLLAATAPPLAHILTLATVDHGPTPAAAPDTFTIIPSTAATCPGDTPTWIPPDAACCPDCLTDTTTPTNRRYLYPLTSCTNCGPRASIIRDLPYDRPTTTLADFPLCPDCAAEYTDPTNRRYHAQPISCWNCGPTYQLIDHTTPTPTHTTITRTNWPHLLTHIRHQLDTGHILALHGIGGYHLLADATNPTAIQRLRTLKHRPHKPLALLIPTLADARRLTQLAPTHETLLTSPAAPIIIAPLSDDGRRELAHTAIAPGHADVGIMLPYTPIHHLIATRPLVATSANPTGEPIATTWDQGETLPADLILRHNRPIHTPIEDSVYRGSLPIRRSRGFAPLPLALPLPATTATPILAAGGELKNTIALAEPAGTNTYLYLSGHQGDMASTAAQHNWHKAAQQLTAARKLTPAAIACDLHPSYATTRLASEYATNNGITLIPVQHHLAHAAALIADHMATTATPLPARATIATLDGTGYGTDGTIWGGEILTVDTNAHTWTRNWHLPPFPLAGGDTAVTYPWRILAGIEHSWGLDLGTLWKNLPEAMRTGAARRPDMFSFEQEKALVDAQIAAGNTAQTTSLGRFLDAAAALVAARWDGALAGGIRQTYEGQAASELEHLAVGGQVDQAAPDELGPLLEWVAQAPTTPADAARTVHQRVAAAVAGQLAALASGADWVGISGGCAVNSLLVGDIRQHLGAYELVTHHKIPPTDGGLAAGQALAALLELREV